jgi:hypothetical protein
VRANRECVGAQNARCSTRFGADVNANTAEVGAKSRFHQCARAIVERLTGGAELLPDFIGCSGLRPRRGSRLAATCVDINLSDVVAGMPAIALGRSR